MGCVVKAGFCYESRIVWKSAEMAQKISSFVQTVQDLGCYKFMGGGKTTPLTFEPLHIFSNFEKVNDSIFSQ